jgi:hypothetical protein
MLETDHSRSLRRQQCVEKRLRVEVPQVLESLPDADEAERHLYSLGDREQDASLGGAVQLR